MGAHSSSLKWAEKMMIDGAEKEINSWAALHSLNYREEPPAEFPVNVTYHVDWAWKHIHHVTLTLYPDGSFKRVVKKEPYAPGGVCSSPDGSPTENTAGAFDETNLQYIEPAVYCGLYKYEAKAGRAGQDHISLAEAPVLESGEFPSDKLTYRSVALCPESHYIADDAQGMGFIFATPGPLRTTGDAPASGGGVGGASPPFRLSVDQLTPSSPTKAPEIESSDGDSFMVKLMAAQSGGGGGGGSSSMVAAEKVVEIDDEDAKKE